jgi:hypothetical protein
MSEAKKPEETYKLEDVFRFRCGKNVACFNECCRDVTIFLGPFDVLRLRLALQITAQELIDRYTTVLVTDRLLPLIALRMNKENELRCHFVTPEGCSVYSFRPWACRMFPLDVTEDGKAFKTLIGSDRCFGLKEELVRPVIEYLNEQGTPKYQVMDDLMGDLINSDRFRSLDVENDQIRQMIFMALYDMDSFRKFVFETSFLDKFEIDKRRLKRLERDDEELLRLGFEWVAFGLLGRQTLKLKDGAAPRGGASR